MDRISGASAIYWTAGQGGWVAKKDAVLFPDLPIMTDDQVANFTAKKSPQPQLIESASQTQQPIQSDQTAPADLMPVALPMAQDEQVAFPAYAAPTRNAAQAKLTSWLRGAVDFKNPRSAHPQPVWLVKNIIEVGTVSLLAGVSGAGKSFAAIEMAIAAADGRQFFGRNTKRPRGVLYLAGEAIRSADRRISLALTHKGIFSPALELMPVDNISTPEGREALVTLLREKKATMFPALELVIIDTLAASCGIEDENNNSEAAKVMKFFEMVAEEFKVAIVVTAHYGKAAETGVRGASAYTGGPRRS